MKLWLIIIALIVVVVGGFIIFSPNSQDAESDSQPSIQIVNEKSDQVHPPAQKELPSENEKPLWLTAQLTDVRTGETFSIDQFDKPILLESFAVWCPTCTRQQKEVKELHEEIGDSAISISLNTDPNEDEQKVLDHINRNDFDWHYAVSPESVTLSLREQFGLQVINAPSAPVIIIDENKNARLLHSGVKSAAELKGELGL